MDLNSTYEDVEERRQAYFDCIKHIRRAHFQLLFYYERFCFFRDRKDYQVYSLSYLNDIQEILDVFSLMSTSGYAWYVDYYRNSMFYVDYAAELQKIKHKILESEVNWYIENITQQIRKKNYESLFFQPILKQEPLLARHTFMVIYFALEQLEIIASKTTIDNANANDQERYTWCLTAMVPLLPEADQDPFKENGIHQRQECKRKNERNWGLIKYIIYFDSGEKKKQYFQVIKYILCQIIYILISQSQKLICFE